MQPTSNNAAQTASGRFKLGNKFGRGRQVGSRNRASVLLDALADIEAKTILHEVVTRAKEGDLKAAEIVLARVWPPRKGRLVRFNLAPGLTPKALPEALAQVIEAAANGVLTIDEAAAFASLLDAQRKAYELGELTRRIQALERIAGRT